MVWCTIKRIATGLFILDRYINKKGDQDIDYSVISGNDAIKRVNKLINDAAKSGSSSGVFSINRGTWGDLNLGFSFGGVNVYYKVYRFYETGEWHDYAYCKIDDPYDFHSPFTVSMDYLDHFWNGGTTVYDTWMQQLAEHSYAEVFHTFVNWKFLIE